MATRLGVDFGGTFTDPIFYDDETGKVGVSKEPTTPQGPEDARGAALATCARATSAKKQPASIPHAFS